MDKNIRKIDASLEYGEIFSIALMSLVYLMLILGVFGTILTVFCVFYDKEYTILYVLPFLLFVTGISIYIICFHKKQIGRVKTFLNDAVELTAKTNMLDSSYSQNGFFRVSITKISVIFDFNGTHIIRQSGLRDYNGKSRNNKGGYNKVFNKYANRQIQILYSPKYDQVLILKDKKQAKKK